MFGLRPLDMFINTKKKRTKHSTPVGEDQHDDAAGPYFAPRKSQEEPGGAKRTRGPGGARRSQGNHEEPGGDRRSQEEPKI